MTVPLVLLVADSEMAFTLLQLCEGPEKHITIATEVEVISVTLRLSAQERRGLQKTKSTLYQEYKVRSCVESKFSHL